MLERSFLLGDEVLQTAPSIKNDNPVGSQREHIKLVNLSVSFIAQFVEGVAKKTRQCLCCS